MTTRELFTLRYLIDNGESYGLELVRGSNGLLKKGTVYVLLHRLEKNGLVSSRKKASQGRGPERRAYKVTGQGETAFNSQVQVFENLGWSI